MAINEQEKEKKEIEIPSIIMVKDFAAKLELPVSEVISKLMMNGVAATINEKIDFETASIIADDFGFESILEKEEKKEKKENQKDISKNKKSKKSKSKSISRPPVVAILGHVDHGKTTLLDKIRQANVVAQEKGGITQHISSYQVEKNGKIITFLDTPGHAAFAAIRERGVILTDIAVLVAAADDGVKPQTIEAIKYCREKQVPIIVAINKIDKPEADVSKVKKELSEQEIAVEDWGGKTVAVEISAKTGQGIDELLEMILLVADMESLSADPKAPAIGIVIESRLDPKRGALAVVLVRDGTLKTGDFLKIGETFGKIKRLEDFNGNKVKKAKPSMPVTVVGLNKCPQAGDYFEVVKDKKEALFKISETTPKEKIFSVNSSITEKIKQKSEMEKVKKVNIVLKVDTKGSLEAILGALNNIKSEEVALNILKAEIGNISESDIKTARAVQAEIIGFNVSVDSFLQKLAVSEGVEIKNYDVIYKLIDEIKKSTSELLEPEIIRQDLGNLEVIAVFKTGKFNPSHQMKMIVGAKVLSGKITKKSLLDIYRDEEKIGQGKISELQLEKNKVEEIKEGQNAGINFKGDVKIELKDKLKAYLTEEKKREL